MKAVSCMARARPNDRKAQSSSNFGFSVWAKLRSASTPLTTSQRSAEARSSDSGNRAFVSISLTSLEAVVISDSLRLGRVLLHGEIHGAFERKPNYAGLLIDPSVF